MNILGQLQRWGTSLLNLVTEGTTDVEAKEGDAEGADGPGAGGGYETKDSVEILSDGPGAGGGYEERLALSDGPGAGGGYDDSDADTDDDGPGAGGGYEPKTSSTKPKRQGGKELVALSDGPGAGGGYHGVPKTIFASTASETISSSPQASEYFLTEDLGYIDGQNTVTVTDERWTTLAELHAEGMFPEEAAKPEKKTEEGNK